MTKTSEAERQEMLAELKHLMKKQHPWMMLLRALKEGDEEVARLVVEAGDDRLSDKDKMKAHYMIKSAFPESPEQRRASQDEQREQTRSDIGAALAAKLKSRRARQEKIVARSKPSRGPNAILGQPEDDHHFAQPNPGGYNLPVFGGPPRKGAGRDKVRGAYPA